MQLSQHPTVNSTERDNRALEIIQTLADGVDPMTGEVFDEQSPYNHPTVIRSLFCCLGMARRSVRKRRLSPEQRRADNIAKGLPGNAGLPWTEALRQQLAAGFGEGETPAQLAMRFERTSGSIVAQLKKQGLIAEDEARNY